MARSKISKISSLFILLVLSLALIGCNGELLLENLSQKQSLQIVNFLSSNGIEVYPEKASGSRDKYIIKVAGSDYFDAVSLLERAQLPKPEKQSADELLTSGGIFPQSREIEQLRLERIYASEIEELISKYNGVNQAEAVVRLASNSNPSPAVNLHIKIVPQTPVQTSQIVESISRIVPGVVRDRISISIDEVDNSEITTPGVKTESFLGFAKVASEDRRGLALAFTLCLLLFGAGGGIMGYYFGMLKASGDSGKEGTNGSSRGNVQTAESNDELLPKIGGMD